MKIRRTKKGQPYIILKSGRARFIKKSKSRRKRTRSSSKTKPKRRYSRMAKKKTYRRKSSGGMLGKLNKPLIGAAGVILYESMLSPMIPLQGTAKDLLELVGGLWLSKKSGAVGATGKTLVTLNAYQLMSGLIGSKLIGLVKPNGATTSSYVYG